MLLGVLKGGCDLDGGLADVPQMDGQTHQQGFAEADIRAVHEDDVVHVGKVCGQLGALVGAGKLMGQEDAHDLVSGGSSRMALQKMSCPFRFSNEPTVAKRGRPPT